MNEVWPEVKIYKQARLQIRNLKAYDMKAPALEWGINILKSCIKCLVLKFIPLEEKMRIRSLFFHFPLQTRPGIVSFSSSAASSGTSFGLAGSLPSFASLFSFFTWTASPPRRFLLVAAILLRVFALGRIFWVFDPKLQQAFE